MEGLVSLSEVQRLRNRLFARPDPTPAVASCNVTSERLSLFHQPVLDRRSRDLLGRLTRREGDDLIDGRNNRDPPPAVSSTDETATEIGTAVSPPRRE